MTDIARMESALKNAHAAGDVQAAKAIANALKAAQQAPQANNELSAMSQSMSAPKSDVDRQVRASMEASKLEGMRLKRLPGSGVMDQITSGMMFGLDDELGGVIGAPFRAIRDQVGLKEAYGREAALLREQKRRNREKTGAIGTGAEIAGSLMTGGALSKIGPMAASAGRGLAARIGAGAAEGAAYGAVSGAGNADGDVSDAVSGGTTGALLGGAVGGGLPVIGAGLRAVGGKVASGVRSVASPKSEAQSRIAKAMQNDAGNIALQSGDDAIAAANNQRLMNVDRGGETTRALARAASNVEPDARATFQRAADDRFASQGDRAVDIIKKVAGGEVDDIAFQETIRNQARVSNAAAYKAAMSSPSAQSVFTPKLQQLMQSPAVRAAVRSAPTKSANRSLHDIANPFEVNSRGAYVLRKKADGTLISPNLGFWDQVKRNLDDQIGKAQRSGERSTAADLMNLKTQLVDELDNVVPAYKTARAGAAAAFGAEDAVDAGKKYARVSRNTPEMVRALGKMTDAEKKAFKAGFASELIDKVKSTNDRSNVIRSMFQSAESREKVVAAFGEGKARELEAFVRIEGAMDALRGSMGNSTTARQLMELGLVGGGNAAAGGYGLVTGDFRLAALTGAATGVRYGRRKVDDAVMKEMAKILTSSDKAAMNKVAANSMMSKSYMETVRRLTDALMSMQGAAAGVTGARLAAE